MELDKFILWFLFLTAIIWTGCWYIIKTTPEVVLNTALHNYDYYSVNDNGRWVRQHNHVLDFYQNTLVMSSKWRNFLLMQYNEICFSTTDIEQDIFAKVNKKNQTVFPSYEVYFLEDELEEEIIDPDSAGWEELLQAWFIDFEDENFDLYDLFELEDEDMAEATEDMEMLNRYSKKLFPIIELPTYLEESWYTLKYFGDRDLIIGYYFDDAEFWEAEYFKRYKHVDWIVENLEPFALWEEDDQEDLLDITYASRNKYLTFGIEDHLIWWGAAILGLSLIGHVGVQWNKWYEKWWHNEISPLHTSTWTVQDTTNRDFEEFMYINLGEEDEGTKVIEADAFNEWWDSDALTLKEIEDQRRWRKTCLKDMVRYKTKKNKKGPKPVVFAICVEKNKYNEEELFLFLEDLMKEDWLETSDWTQNFTDEEKLFEREYLMDELDGVKNPAMSYEGLETDEQFFKQYDYVLFDYCKKGSLNVFWLWTTNLDNHYYSKYDTDE